MLTFVLGIIVGLLIGWWIWARGAAQHPGQHGHGAHGHDGQRHGGPGSVAAEPAPSNVVTAEPSDHASPPTPIPTPMIDSRDAIAPTGVPHVVDNRMDVPIDANAPIADEVAPADDVRTAPLSGGPQPAEAEDDARFGEPPVSDAGARADDGETLAAGSIVDEAARERARAIGIAPAEVGARGDDLTRIKGIGPRLEEMLHDLGVYTFAQVAAWSEEEADRVDDNLTAFKGRVRRDDWRAQAKDLKA